MKNKIIVTGIIALGIVACSQGGSKNANAELESANLHLHLESQLQTEDKNLQLDFLYEDQSTLQYLYANTEVDSILYLEDLNPGSNVRLSARILDSIGNVRYLYEQNLNLQPGIQARANLVMVPQFAKIEAVIPLGAGNPYDIQSGTFILKSSQGDSISVAMQRNPKGMGLFDLGEIFWGDGYQVSVKLYDGQNRLVFEKQSEIDINAQSGAQIVLHLESLFGQLALELHLLAAQETQIQMVVPSSKLRAQIKVGELRFTELLPNPRTSGDTFEYIEVFNGSLDSLDLANCSIGRTRDSQSGSQKMNISQWPVIAPGDYHIFGRDSVPFANSIYSGLTLVNSGQSLVLSCDTLLIDSINYTSETGNAFAVNQGEALELIEAEWNSPLLATSWCSGSEAVFYNSEFQTLGSPGKGNLCN